MAVQKKISAEQLDQFRQQLRDLRDRLVNQVDSGVESIREEMNPAGTVSNLPVHLADAAEGQIDADIRIIESERNMLQDVQDALHRIEAGSFGKCVACGAPIAANRLRVIPYTPYCVPCAEKQGADREPVNHRSSDRTKLTGFDAIEYAEQECLKLNKAGDSIDEAVHGLTIAEAEAIASEDPDLIWLEIPSDDYGVRKNMRPGR